MLSILTVLHIRTALAHDEFMILNDTSPGDADPASVAGAITLPAPVRVPTTPDAQDRLSGLHGMIRSLLIGLGVLSVSFGLFLLLGVFLLADEDPATPTWMWTLSAIPVAGGLLFGYLGLTRFRKKSR